MNPTLAAIALLLVACNREPVLNVGLDVDTDAGSDRDTTDAGEPDAGPLATIDLRITGPHGVSGAVPGELVTFRVGAAAREPFSTSVRIGYCKQPCDSSQATTILDVPLALAAPGEKQVDVEARLPADAVPGDYLIASAVDPDDETPEADETNNRLEGQMSVTYYTVDVIGGYFELEAVGCEGRQWIQIRSLVGFPLPVSVTEAYPSAFSVPTSLPPVLDAYGTLSFEIAYLAPDLGNHVGQFVVDFNNGLEQRIIQAQGTSTSPGIPHQDTRVQTSMLIDRWGLDYVAEPSSVRVEIDGQSSTAWTYHFASRSVVFEPTAIPPEGSTIVIAYTGPDC